MESLKIMSNSSLKIQHGNQSLILVHAFSSNFEFEDQIKFVNSNVNTGASLAWVPWVPGTHDFSRSNTFAPTIF